GKQVARLDSDGDHFAWRVAYSPDSKLLATAGGDKTIRVWDVKTAREKHVFKGHTDQVCSVAFAPNGDELISASFDGSVRFWSLREGTETGSLAKHDDRLFAVAYSRDGSRIARGGTHDALRQWKAATLDELDPISPQA